MDKFKDVREDEVTILTLKEVAEKLKLHPNTLRRYAKEGKLPAMKFGRVWRIEEEDLKGFMRAMKQGVKR